MRSRSLTLVVSSLAALASACGGGESPPPLPPPPPTVPTAAIVVPPPPVRPPRIDEHLIPRHLLFGNPDHTAPQVSPDGKYLAFAAPVDGVLNVMVAKIGSPLDLSTAVPVSHEKSRPVGSFTFTQLPGKLVYQQDVGGDENYHLFLVDLADAEKKGAQPKDLTPYQGARADLANKPSRKHPGEIVVTLNDRDPKFPDAYRIDLATGKRTLLAKNDHGYAGFEIDHDDVARLAYRNEKDGSQSVLMASKPATPEDTPTFEKVLLTVPLEDSFTTHVTGFDDSGKTLYIADTRQRDTAGLVALDVTSGKSALLAEDPKADVGVALSDPRTGRPLVASAFYEREHHRVLDRSVQADEDFLKGVVPGADWSWETCSDSFRHCIVRFTVSDGPTKWFLYDRTKKNAAFVFSSRPPLEKLPLAKMVPEVIDARDGLHLVSYLTLPTGSDPDGDGKPSAPVPLVLLVHGGPWARDDWGFRSYPQWLANRGYAVLSVNFRGSEGFGKSFLNAGNLQWGAKMHDDLLDAVHWAVANRIADPAKVAIFGGSYGGYAALVGESFTPDTFACGVDLFGPANLVTLQATIPPYWEALRDQFYRRIGDPRTDDGKAFLLSRSPVTHVGAIKRPLLIAQGQNDPRVNPAESQQIVDGMKAKDIPVTYVVFSDEGHGFHRPQNNEAALAVAETFLAQCLDGAYEPIGTSFQGSTIAVPAGAKQVYGLEDAIHAQQR